MSRFRIKKQPLIAVAGSRLAARRSERRDPRRARGHRMRGLAAIVLVALAGGAVAIFCAFHPMFSNSSRRTPNASPTWRGSAIMSSASSTVRATS